MHTKIIRSSRETRCTSLLICANNTGYNTRQLLNNNQVGSVLESSLQDHSLLGGQEKWIYHWLHAGATHISITLGSKTSKEMTGMTVCI